MAPNVWVVMLEGKRAQVFVLKKALKFLEPLKEISAPDRKTEEAVVRELASYLDHQADHEQFDKFVLASSTKLVGLLCAKIKLKTCKKFVGTVHFEEQPPTVEELFIQVMAAYQGDL